MDEFESGPEMGYDDGSGDLAESLVLDTRELASLAADDLLDVAGEQKGLARLLATNQLVIAARYAATHVDRPGAPGLRSEQVRQIHVAGEGSALVSEYAPLALAHALGTTAESAQVLMAHALELRDRLPVLWARVTAGEVEAWRARQVAATTLPESPEVVALVDEDLSSTTRAIHTPTATDAVTAAVAQLDAAEAERREALRADRRGVHLDRERLTGLPERWADVHARLDTPDAEALDATLDRLADVLERNAMVEAPHDPDLAMTHRHWRARALGLLADPHLAAEVLDSAATGEQVETRRGAGVLYVHVRADGDDLAPAVDLERYGTTTLDLARAWLGERAK
ncbi:MAG: hypothetical protein Q8Q02_16840, partial [Nocardioides sp.]|nr:hypothetical protein [Nocardioides sp.]